MLFVRETVQFVAIDRHFSEVCRLISGCPCFADYSKQAFPEGGVNWSLEHFSGRKLALHCTCQSAVLGQDT